MSDVQRADPHRGIDWMFHRSTSETVDDCLPTWLVRLLRDVRRVSCSSLTRLEISARINPFQKKLKQTGTELATKPPKWP